jgi:hypothetical protein
MVLVFVFVGAIVALIVSRFIIGPADREQTAEVVDVITSDFPPLPEKYYNANSINPTLQIQIGGTTNPSPFNTKPQ